MIDPEKLKTFYDVLVKDPALKKNDGNTFCNLAIHRAGLLFDYNGFLNLKGEPMNAREIITHIGLNKDEWIICGGKQAADYALRGGWGIAFMEIFKVAPDTKKLTTDRALHDHVANVYPAALQVSGSLGVEVPLVANVGERNEVCKSSKAFPTIQGEALYAIHV